MRRISILLALLPAAGCSTTATHEPSLAPRAAEAIDPRVPIPDEVPAGNLDPALAGSLSQLVAEARSGVPEFDAREAKASQLASAAGPAASESWIAAQLALSRLVEQYGVTTRVAANIDALASGRIETQRWIAPANQQAISTAAAEVGSINSRQAEAIDRIKNQLAR